MFRKVVSVLVKPAAATPAARSHQPGRPFVAGIGRVGARIYVVLWTGLLALAGSGPPGVAADLSFPRDILPLLSENCFSCHGPDAQSRKAELRLDTASGAWGRGRSGEPAIVPGKPELSEVMRRLTTEDPDDVMPPPKSKKPLTSTQVELIRRWIQEGASWGQHWAYEPPRQVAVPVVAGAVHHPIDAFIRATLVQEGLEPAPEASRATLIRRVTLDLTGLPPAAEAVAAFVGDPAPDAYERLVDQLLASPRYGERMAWEWLEVARYADSNGYQGDSERTMWPWRDWVVQAFNDNLPFDQFTVWQLAGDLLPEPSPEQRLATAFLRHHMINGEGGRIPEENRIDYLFDQTETVATTWLAATFNCTRCHDHKYDPHTQRDYFALLAFFNQTSVDGSGGNPQTPPVLEWPSAEQVRQREEANAILVAAVRATEEREVTVFPRESGQPLPESAAAQGLPEPVLSILKISPQERDSPKLETLITHFRDSDAAYAEVLEQQRQARRNRDAVGRDIPQVMVMEDRPKPRATFLLNRGSYLQPGDEVGLALPAALTAGETLSSSNRLGLAQWLVSPDNPLTARVTVNRWWQSLFGVGLVKTSEDFGVQGERPVHPELLDWLARELIESGWDVKHLIRLMVTSATYRQTSKVTPDLVERDPENRLLARGPRFRMPSWMIRDAALAVAGLLTEEQGGRPVKPYQPVGVWEEATFGNKRYEQDHGDALYRRSLYVFWRRIVGPTMFFDVASRQTCTVKTPRTNVPLHALLTLNDPAYLEAARAFAQRLLLSGGEMDSDRITHACEWALGRSPKPEERDLLIRALARHRATFRADPAAATQLLTTGETPRNECLDPKEHAAWMVLCSTILNLDEFLTKE